MNRPVVRHMLAVLVAVALVLTACGDQDVAEVAERPVVRLQAGGEAFEENVYSYCWPDSADDLVCDVDAVALVQPRENVAVAPGDSVTFVLADEEGVPTPRSFRATLLGFDRVDQYGTASEGVFEAALPEDLYRIKVDVEYEDVEGYEAHVSYVFGLHVTSAVAASEPSEGDATATAAAVAQAPEPTEPPQETAEPAETETPFVTPTFIPTATSQPTDTVPVVPGATDTPPPTETIALSPEAVYIDAETPLPTDAAPDAASPAATRTTADTVVATASGDDEAAEPPGAVSPAATRTTAVTVVATASGDDEAAEPATDGTPVPPIATEAAPIELRDTPAALPTDAPSATETPLAAPTLEPTATARPTEMPSPTPTPALTETLPPSETPLPAPSPTPVLTETPAPTVVPVELGHVVLSGIVRLRTAGVTVPVVGAEVSYIHTSPVRPERESAHTTVTDAGGRFEFDPIFINAADEIVVSAYAPGFQPHAITRSGALSWESEGRFQFVLEPIRAEPRIVPLARPAESAASEPPPDQPVTEAAALAAPPPQQIASDAATEAPASSPVMASLPTNAAGVPALELVFAGQVYAPMGYQFCQRSQSGERICLEFPSQNAVNDRLRLLRGSAAQMVLPGERPLDVTLEYLSDSGQHTGLPETRSGDNTLLFVITPEAGSYIMSVRARWDMSEAAYFYRVLVVD